MQKIQIRGIPYHLSHVYKSWDLCNSLHILAFWKLYSVVIAYQGRRKKNTGPVHKQGGGTPDRNQNIYWKRENDAECSEIEECAKIF